MHALPVIGHFGLPGKVHKKFKGEVEVGKMYFPHRFWFGSWRTVPVWGIKPSQASNLLPNSPRQLNLII